MSRQVRPPEPLIVDAILNLVDAYADQIAEKTEWASAKDDDERRGRFSTIPDHRIALATEKANAFRIRIEEGLVRLWVEAADLGRIAAAEGIAAELQDRIPDQSNTVAEAKVQGAWRDAAALALEWVDGPVGRTDG
jgi:hypothetical protein